MPGHELHFNCSLYREKPQGKGLLRLNWDKCLYGASRHTTVTECSILFLLNLSVALDLFQYHVSGTSDLVLKIKCVYSSSIKNIHHIFVRKRWGILRAPQRVYVVKLAISKDLNDCWEIPVHPYYLKLSAVQLSFSI